MTQIIKAGSDPETTQMDPEDNSIELGRWFWVSHLHSRRPLDDFNVEDPRPRVPELKADEDEEAPEDGEDTSDDDDEDEEEEEEKPKKPPPARWLACVTEIGTNYAELTGPNGQHQRIHFDRFDKWCVREDMPKAYTERKVKEHSKAVAGLLDEVRRLTMQLGVVPRKSIDDGASEASTVLAVAHGTADIKAHALALADAKENKLPALFKQVKERHELMATWMKADLVEAQAQLEQMKKSVSVIDDRIFTVKLYAGLTEELKQVRKGAPAADEEKVHVFQRRHYMDEECLARYEAGGMEFKDIKAFDKWLSRVENFSRILPFSRSIVAFRVRRNAKEREVMDSFIRFDLEKEDKITFLYIRNGGQLWRLNTEIDFGSDLFPDAASNELLSNSEALYVKPSSSIKPDDIITESSYLHRKANFEKTKAERDAYTKEWNALSKEERAARQKKNHNAEPFWRYGHSWDAFERAGWQRVDKDSVYYDDVMRVIAGVAVEHNRVATVLQGLLDRSECLLPHPPWKIWTPDGFRSGIELIYDDSRTLTSGPAADFETYRMRLNMSIKVGTMTIGQEDAFLRREAVRENAREQKRYDRRGRSSDYERTWHRPHGNPGPSFVAKVEKMRGDKCVFTWKRESQRATWVPADRPGYRRREYAQLDDSIAIPPSRLFNVTAYTPGDFHMFFDDPRTRRKYLQWAPFLLSAEDYHADPKSFANCNVRHVPLSGADKVKDEEQDAPDEDADDE
jgi:hypothetical protein